MTLASVFVRRAGPGDEMVLRALRLEALSESPAAFASTLEREAARTIADWRGWFTSGVTFVLEEAGTARGLVAGVRDSEDAAVVYLMAMWVHPALRGSGAADVLVAEHLAWARSVRAARVRLDVMADNVRARRFYERHGYRITGRQKIHDADGRVELQMERTLLPEPS